MSLLMDALKKAEQEKKEAAKRLRESENENQSVSLEDKHGQDSGKTGDEKQSTTNESGADITSTGENLTALELSLAPIDQHPNTDRQRAHPANEIKKPAGENENASLLSLETTLNGEEIGSPEEDSEQPSQDINELDSDVQEAEDLDQTFHGIALADGAVPGVDLDNTDGDDSFPPEAPSYEETLPGIPAEQLSKDLGGEGQPTPVAAQTVFVATDRYKGGTSGFRWLLIGCCFAAVLAGSVWYYYTVTPMNVDLPSPLVAQGTEPAIIAQPVTLPDEVISGTLVGSPEIAMEQEETASETPAETTVAESPAETAPESDVNTTLDSAPQDKVPAAAEIAVAAPVTGENIPADNTEPTVSSRERPETIELSPSLIKISRSKGVDYKGQLVSEAYAAYMTEDYSIARGKYAEVLAKQPDNRDALLGIGAIATKSGETLDALRAYVRLLRINPKDKLAQTLLINLQSSAEMVRNESAVKVMIHENPDLPYLYFTLGNIYANQSRWSEAQQAFFDAYRQDSSNPDYALNLAVSLDRIGQYGSALDYYNTALKLSDNRVANFDPALIISRIQTLSSAENP